MAILEFYSVDERGDFHHKNADMATRNPTLTTTHDYARKVSVNTDDVLAVVRGGYYSYTTRQGTEHRHVRQVVTREGSFHVAAASPSTDVPADIRTLDEIGGKPLVKLASTSTPGSILHSQTLYGFALPVVLSGKPEDLAEWSRGDVHTNHLCAVKVHGMFAGKDRGEDNRIDLSEGTAIYSTTIRAGGIVLHVAQLDKSQLEKIPAPVAVVKGLQAQATHVLAK